MLQARKVVANHWSFPVTPPVCNDPNDNNPGSGGCSSTCYCDGAVNGQAYCTQDNYCGAACTTDADCSNGSFCSNRPLAVSVCGSNICEAYDGCTSSYTPSSSKKRSLNILGFGTDRLGRLTRVNEARSAWEEKRGECSRTNTRC